MEFKKGADSEVLSQAAFYLSWLCSARHEFEALVKERLGSEAAEAVDWGSPRMVCFAASFSQYDRVAVYRLPERVDLVRYTVHRTRDVTFREDHCQVRTANAPAVLAAVHDLIRGTLRAAGYATTATGRRGHADPQHALTLYRIE